MGEIKWVQVIVALLGGGAAGAIINAIVSAYRARRQPVGRRVDVLPVFRQTGGGVGLRAKIAITHDNQTTTFENLFLAEVQVVNSGNSDIIEFEFGATLGDGDRCIYVEAVAPDRHHRVAEQTPTTPQAPQHEVDFKLKPFNRGDSYSFKLYVVIPEGQDEPKAVRLGSSSPVRFVEMPTVGEVLAGVASEWVVSLGPFRIRVRR
jgi:hypothetical protein